MSEYNRSEAYDLSYAIPAVKIPQPEYEIPYETETRNKSRKNTAKAKKRKAGTVLRLIRIFVVCGALFILFAGLLVTRINIETLEKESDKLTAMLTDAQSENTRLRSQLSSSISREKVEAYAVDVLGMQKLERYQIHYFDDKEEDSVVLANGRTVQKDTEQNEKE